MCKGSDIKEIKLECNYYQFYGIFYFWLHVSFPPDGDYTPKYIRFLLPDKRKILATTETICFDSAKTGDKVSSIKKTRWAELLRSAYQAQDFEASGMGWQEKLIIHACKYYKTQEQLDLYSDSLDNMHDRDKELENKGIVKLLLLRKIKECNLEE